MKYVKDFEYPESFGFNGSAGKQMVTGYCRAPRYSKGGLHEDRAQDRAMIRTAVHKHERALHPGKPLTKLKRGGR